MICEADKMPGVVSLAEPDFVQNLRQSYVSRRALAIASAWAVHRPGQGFSVLAW